MKVLDLFSGLGGFSEAFVQSGHEVLRIENNPLLSEVPHTQIIDIFEFRDILLENIRRGHPIQRPDVILASPPCREFSNAFNAPRAQAHRAGFDYEPDMKFVNVAKEIIDLLKPKWWIIENVYGSRIYFEPILGRPSQAIRPYILYGNYPKIPAGNYGNKKDKDQRHSPLRANYRAQIPIELSQALLCAILEQQYIIDY